ncbi:unnamed protein product, partial [Mesorhabditis spiculigera]
MVIRRKKGYSPNSFFDLVKPHMVIVSFCLGILVTWFQMRKQSTDERFATSFMLWYCMACLWPFLTVIVKTILDTEGLLYDMAGSERFFDFIFDTAIDAVANLGTSMCFVVAVWHKFSRCVFDVRASASSLDVEGGIDKCESSDKYCANIDFNGIKAKGCSRTALKIHGDGLPTFVCDQAGCNAQKTLCCCEGNKCNGATGISALLSLLSFGAVWLFMKK